MKRGDWQSSDLPSDRKSGGGDSEPRPADEVSTQIDHDRKAELELIDAALRGDMEAFAAVFERYRSDLYALCLKRLGDPSLAEDIVQEVFIRAFISLPNSDYRRPLWPWLATIASRMCIDLQRRRSFIDYSGDIASSVDADAGNGTSEREAASALDAVIASEERAEVWESLAVLPKRQRRVFLLYAVDGWSCADIASAEGISVDAVKHLLFRARRKMRATRQSGLPALVVFPCKWLRSRFQEWEERVRLLLGVFGDRVSAGTAAVSLGVLAVIAATISHPVESFEKDSAVRSDEQAVSITQTQMSRTASSNPAAPARARAPGDSQQPVSHPVSTLVQDVINPNQSATPEDVFLHSMAASPNYESDHMVLAVGHSSGRGYVLFISHDGGGTWQPRPSRFLDGSTLVLPPDFPHDRRIFTFGGTLGLHQSDDGGAIFRVASPIPGRGVAISPSFGRGDSKILMGGRTVFEYDAGTGVTLPVPAIPPPPAGGTYPSIAFSPTHPYDSTVFASDERSSYRCKGTFCDVIQLPTDGPLRLRFSPRFDQDGLAYAFTPWKLLVSSDGAQTFGEVRFPLEPQPPLSSGGYIHDVAIAWNLSSSPAIFVSVYEFSSDPRYPPGIYRSLDSGGSWSKTSIDLLGIGIGAKKLIVTPTGRLLASGELYGITCSEDGGQTWAPRCTPEP